MSQKEISRRYYLKHRKRILKWMKNYYKENKSKITKRVKKYQNQHREEHKLYMRNYNLIYYRSKKEYINFCRNSYFKNKRKIDFNFRLLCYLRSRVWLALKGNPKLSTTQKLLGCSIKHLKKHLENKFTKGMNWSNYGRIGWHIDHIKPCASFDLSKQSEQRKCFHYSNLRPLWAKENLRKNRY